MQFVLVLELHSSLKEYKDCLQEIQEEKETSQISPKFYISLKCKIQKCVL
jgi:hypothetical protein